MMTRQLQDPDLPARFPMGLAAARDENGEALALVRCNDGTIWLDTGNATVPWRRLPAIPEPTAEEVEALEREERAQAVKRQRAFDAAYMNRDWMYEAPEGVAELRKEDEERQADAKAEQLLASGWRPTAATISQYLPPPYRRLP